jgi:hypothetical protein
MTISVKSQPAGHLAKLAEHTETIARMIVYRPRHLHDEPRKRQIQSVTSLLVVEF